MPYGTGTKPRHQGRLNLQQLAQKALAKKPAASEPEPSAGHPLAEALRDAFAQRQPPPTPTADEQYLYITNKGMAREEPIDPRVQERLEETSNVGLIDSLSRMVGQDLRIDRLRSGLGLGNDRDGYNQLIGIMGPGMSFAVDPTINRRDFRETLLHETGHLLGHPEKAPADTLPYLRSTHEEMWNRPRFEVGAKGFRRAWEALGELQRDTSNSDAILRAFEQGHQFARGRMIAPGSGGRLPGTEAIARELLQTPLFAEHPLNKKRQ